MTPYEQMNAFMDSYSPQEDIGILNLIYKRYRIGLQKLDEGDTYHVYQLYATYDQEPYIDFSEDHYLRDEHGSVLATPEAREYARTRLDEEYTSLIRGEFVRTRSRLDLFKEELMMNVWHPRRIERLLEIGGEAALDNFAGV
jgi:hypothetical protein